MKTSTKKEKEIKERQWSLKKEGKKNENAAKYVYACSITVNRDVVYLIKGYGIL